MQNPTTPAPFDLMPDLMRGEAGGLAIACALDGVPPEDLARTGLRPVALADLLAGTGPGVILMDPPVVALARTLVEAAPEAALALWVEAARALLAGYRPRRARLMLLDVARIGDEAVAARLGLRLPLRMPVRMPDVSAAALLAAGRLIGADAGARALAEELEAAMIAAPAPEAVWLAAQTCAMIEEVTLLRALNVAQEAEIERLGRARLADALARPATPAVAPAVTPAADPARLRALEGRVAELEAELAGVYGSRSWRITAPLRDARRALGR
ncbi:hypothetical protein [Paracoccus sp. NSM]|uniref:hypothetical protein n=1 Tax=Paracoccus sp. NSM TaxID=3457784 RepID=UPI0040355F59